MSSHLHPSLSRRGFLAAGAGAGAALALALAPVPARATGPQRPFGRYGSPAGRLGPRTLYVDPLGRGDHRSVGAAVAATGGSGWTLVLAPGVYRETVAVDRGTSTSPRRGADTDEDVAGTRPRLHRRDAGQGRQVARRGPVRLTAVPA